MSPRSTPRYIPNSTSGARDSFFGISYKLYRTQSIAGGSAEKAVRKKSLPVKDRSPLLQSFVPLLTTLQSLDPFCVHLLRQLRIPLLLDLLFPFLLESGYPCLHRLSATTLSEADLKEKSHLSRSFLLILQFLFASLHRDHGFSFSQSCFPRLARAGFGTKCRLSGLPLFAYSHQSNSWPLKENKYPVKAATSHLNQKERVKRQIFI